MSDLRFVCTERLAIPTRSGVKLRGVPGHWSLIRRGDVVDGDNPVVRAFPQHFRPQAPNESHVHIGIRRDP